MQKGGGGYPMKDIPNPDYIRIILEKICSLSTETMQALSDTCTYKSCTTTVQVQKVSPKVLALQWTLSPNLWFFFPVSTETSTKEK